MCEHCKIVSWSVFLTPFCRVLHSRHFQSAQRDAMSYGLWAVYSKRQAAVLLSLDMKTFIKLKFCHSATLKLSPFCQMYTYTMAHNIYRNCLFLVSFRHEPEVVKSSGSCLLNSPIQYTPSRKTAGFSILSSSLLSSKPYQPMPNVRPTWVNYRPTVSCLSPSPSQVSAL